MITVGELKRSSLWLDLDNYFNVKTTQQRVDVLVLLITYLNNSSIRTRKELYIRSSSIERDLDDFYIRFNYSENIHKEDCDYLRCCFLLTKLLENHQLTVKHIIPLLDFFQQPMVGLWETPTWRLV